MKACKREAAAIDEVAEKRPTRQRKAIEPFTYASIGETGSGMEGKNKKRPRPKPGARVKSSSAKKAAAPATCVRSPPRHFQFSHSHKPSMI